VEKNVGGIVEILWKTEQLILQFGIHATVRIFDYQQDVSRTNVWYAK